NPYSLSDIEKKFGKRYSFEKADICDQWEMKRIIKDSAIDRIVHFAAESHVDRSICGPAEFIQTNINGTFSLLESVREMWKDSKDVLFHHVSTDEVYGSLGETGYFFENTPYDPRSPYSASKASSDHLVMAYHHTYGLPVTLSNCSNNYGPYHFPEKLIPLMILNIQEEKPLPVYGDGKNVRDWLYVEDHASGIFKIISKGRVGEKYNIGGEQEIDNLKVVHTLCEKMAEKLGKDRDYFKKLITFVKDRPGHDRRYAINCDKIKNELDWKQSVDFETGIEKTIDWYLNNQDWVAQVRSGDYQKWLDRNYSKR
ncbi:MAG: dTDP-glucose 4,6-dehydratase, partial [Patescibacteria group bacterium]|nr:dTDP-glucose 4,6-dehydratase [Patescibacteria group bacterium]